MQITREKFNAIVEDACAALSPVHADKVRSSVSEINQVAWGIYTSELDGVECGCPLVVAGLLTGSGMSSDLTGREAGDFIELFDEAMEQHVIASDGAYGLAVKVVG